MDRGSATVECIIAPSGAPESCRVLTESPVGVGFGNEAVRAARRARALPSLVNGQPVQSRIRFTLDFLREPEGTVGGGDPSPPAPAPPVRQQPTILQSPSSSRISQAYPAKAAGVRVQGTSGYSHQMNGYALIRCQVGRTGRLDSCMIVEEDPLGFGFGAAALGLASEYRFSPATINGDPVEGWAQIPIEWTGNQ